MITIPYIKQKERIFIKQDKGLSDFVDWLETLPIEQRKGFVAYILNYIAKYSFECNYFGKSTGLDALRSAYNEMCRELQQYENEKKDENGEV